MRPLNYEWPCIMCGITLSLKEHKITKQYCEKCRAQRRKELYNKNNHKIAYIRTYDRIKVNLFKSWVIMFEVKR